MTVLSGNASSPPSFEISARIARKHRSCARIGLPSPEYLQQKKHTDFSRSRGHYGRKERCGAGFRMSGWAPGRNVEVLPEERWAKRRRTAPPRALQLASRSGTVVSILGRELRVERKEMRLHVPRTGHWGHVPPTARHLPSYSVARIPLSQLLVEKTLRFTDRLCKPPPTALGHNLNTAAAASAKEERASRHRSLP